MNHLVDQPVLFLTVSGPFFKRHSHLLRGDSPQFGNEDEIGAQPPLGHNPVGDALIAKDGVWVPQTAN